MMENTTQFSNGKEACDTGCTGEFCGHLEFEQDVWSEQNVSTIASMVGGVAHDLGNVLQSILGFSSILQDQLEEGTSQYDDVSGICEAARCAGGLTRQLLLLSLREDLEYKVQNLNKIIRRNEKMMRGLIGENIELIYDLQHDLKWVRADASQIWRIILNLIVNARDAMSKGGRLFLKTSNVDPEVCEEPVCCSSGMVGYVCLEVIDTGCGICEDVLEHLFEPYFTTKPAGKGTGLGLSVVHRIVLRCGGWIVVNSHVGQGSVFKVYFPAIADSIEPSQNS